MNAMSKTPTDTAVPVEQTPVFDAQTLLAGSSTAKIVLGDQIYILRLTRAGKLILTK